MEECASCLSLSGERRISPGPFIYQGREWVVDHAYPSSYLGWLVIVPRRHVEALHELTPEEFAELVDIQYRLVQVMGAQSGVAKEYLMCFAEGEGFHHVHIHVLARPADLPEEFRGPRIFAFLAVDADRPAVPAADLTVYCQAFTRQLTAISTERA
jgi:diadenosine tetraphosphate (Ap4A) HIT family hydrolase